MTAAWFSTTAAAASDLTFTGYARSPEDGRLLYIESHHVHRAGEVGESRIVLYRCATGGAAFARKQLDYGKVREEPEFSFIDARSGYAEGLRRTAAGLRVYQQESTAAKRREAAVPAGTAIVADAGFDEFVRKHWAELETAKTVQFPFLIPSRLGHLPFKVRKQREAMVDGATSSVIRLTLSGVFGLFLPFIEVSYRKADKVLLRYEGLTNIRDDDGQNLVAVIRFPQAERRTVPDVGLERLRVEPLVTRCPPAAS
jgi:hypothetical protein